ncbi:hypothetical protein ABI59_23835 [Acidobacteria bacterium Mor1]|nr:hypothetical protein ABI59_23835 [Acidobacteria bacterium Mor1]
MSLLAVSCGKVGPPLPPEPRGPLAPETPRVRQLGERVLVSTRLPPTRGDKPHQELSRIELVRVDYPAGANASLDPDVFRRRGVIVGEWSGDPLESGTLARFVDEEPPGEVGGLLRYAVRLEDRRGRGSALVVGSDLVWIAPLPAPGGVSGVATADGVRLRWNAAGDDVRYNVYRQPENGPASEQPLNTAPLSSLEYLDASVEFGSTFIYEVRTSSSESRPFRESESGTPVRIVAEDRFPPASPDGLVAVQEGVAVRLFWNPNRERDLAGYRIERRAGDGPWKPVGPEIVTESLYLDRDVRIGQRYGYRVLALDRADPPNASAPSQAFELDVAVEPVGDPSS